MKLFLFSLCLISTSLYAQVSYTSGNYAAIADSYLVSNASTGLSGFDFSLTGTGYSWNYASLPVINQTTISYFNPNSGGYKPEWCLVNGYVISCNSNFNTLTNLATYGLDSVSLGPASVSNVVNHYRKTTNHLEYTMVGYTINLGGVPIAYPVQYSIPDSVYSFPLSYGNSDSAHSAYTISLTSLGIPFTNTAHTYRRNYVDGWGSLTTPYGTFPNVLKVKTILINNDTAVSGTTTVHTVDTMVQYKWFDTSYGIPVLEADGNITAAGETITGITYLDSARCLQPNALFITSPVVPYFDSANGRCIVNFTNLSTNYDSSYWSFSNGRTSSANAPTDTFYCPGSYSARLIVYNTCTPSLADTLTIPVIIHDSTNFAIAAISTAGSTSVCTGQSVVITGNTGSGYSYQWYNSGAVIAAATSNQYTADSSGSYAMVITNSTGCTDTSAVVNIIVNTYPVAAISPTGTIAVCNGDSATLATAYGSGYNYKWYRNSIALPGATDSSYSATNAGSYAVVVKNGACWDTSAPVVISINPQPIAYSVTGGGSYCEGGTGLEVGMSGSGSGINYQLFLNGYSTGIAVSGAGGTFNFGLQTSAGTYTVMGTNTTTGCSNSMTGDAVIVITPTVSPSVSIVASPSFTVCAGTAVSYSLITIDAGSTPSYTWYVNGSSVATGATYSYIPADGNIVSCMVTSSALCAMPATAADSITMHLLAAPEAYTVTGGGSYCAGGTGVAIGLGGSSIGINYQLYDGSTPVGPGVMGTGGGISFGLQAIAGTYTVSAASLSTTCLGNMADSASISIIPLAVPAIIITDTPASSVCAGTNVIFNAAATNGGSDPIYTWYINGLVAGTDSNYNYIPANGDTVTCLLSSNAACATPDSAMSNSIVITADSIPVISATIISSAAGGITIGEADTLTAITTGGCPAITYQWYINSVPVTGAVSSIFVSSALSNNDTVACLASCGNVCGIVTATDSVIISISNVGVLQVGNNNTIQVFPNPAQRTLFVKLSNQHFNISITDMTGRTVLTASNNFNLAKINSGILDTGIYIIKVTAAGGEIYYRKITIGK